MRKIPTLFKRDPDDMKHVLPEVNPGCEWVLAGEGRATRKFDGMCVLVRGFHMFAREQVKAGGTPPPGFEPVDFDEATGKTQGWIPVTDAKEFRRHHEAWDNWDNTYGGIPDDGTYELVGPKVNKNPEGYDFHALVPHGVEEMTDVPLDYDGLKHYLLAQPHEGIVWHHPDGRMAKLKRRDFA